jgi:hypothetical protein
MAIPNMDDLEPIMVDSLELTPYTANVQIFNSTLARDIPNKINAIAVDFKQWNNNEIGTKGEEYLNNNMSNVATYINNSMTSVVSFINNVVVDNQNTFIATANQNYTDFTNEMKNNIGNYLDSAGAGYSIAQVNSLEFSGETTIEYDANQNITKVVTGSKTTENINYDENQKIVSFTEKIVVDGVTYTKNYEVTYDDNDNPILNEV